MQQYCVYTQDPNFVDVIHWLDVNELTYEPHLNRTRFWVPEGPLLTEFLLKWHDCCPVVVVEGDNYAIH
jgi:hypothetical protein